MAAASAAGAGAKVALIEQKLMGGDCLNVGSILSKTLIRCAKAAHAVKTANNYGIHVEGYSFDFTRVMEHVREMRAKISPNNSAHRYAGLGADVFIGTARFTSRSIVEITSENNEKIPEFSSENDGKISLQFSKAVIATGAEPYIPQILHVLIFRHQNHNRTPALFAEPINRLPLILHILSVGYPHGQQFAQYLKSGQTHLLLPLTFYTDHSRGFWCYRYLVYINIVPKRPSESASVLIRGYSFRLIDFSIFTNYYTFNSCSP